MQPEIGEIFEKSKDPQRLIEELQLYTGKKIEIGKTLMIFDEIQSNEYALNSLKYFAELMPELHFRYTHDFGDTDYESKAYVNGTDTLFKLDNIGMPENWFTLGGSLGFTTGPHELSGRYEYDFGDGLSSHLFNVGYKYLF